MFRLYIFLPNTWKIWEIEENAISYKVDKKSPNLWIICLYIALCCESMLFSFFRTFSHGFCGISLSNTRRTPNLLTCSTALEKKVKSIKMISDTHLRLSQHKSSEIITFAHLSFSQLLAGCLSPRWKPDKIPFLNQRLYDRTWFWWIYDFLQS